MVLDFSKSDDQRPGFVNRVFAATYGINTVLPTGFIPNEDQGVVYINVTAPSGATVERTEAVLDEIQKVTEDMPIVEAVSTLAGYSLVNGVSGASFGMGIVNLKPWDQRRETVNDVIRILEERTQGITDAIVGFRYSYAPGPDPETLDEKINNLQRYAETVISKVR